MDGTAIPWDASVQDFQKGRSGYVVEALEQPLLFPRDMEALKRFKQPDLFMSLKKNLVMVSNLTYLQIKC